MLIALIATTLLGANEESKLLSEALGHMIGKNLRSLEITLDLGALAKGLKEEADGISSPISDEECLQLLSAIEEKSVEQKKEKNLNEAESFLSQSKEKEGISALEDGKVLFEVVKAGTGEAVQRYNSPLVRYQGFFLNGDPITSDKEEDLISLEETLPGLSAGIVGMKEGEVRKIYIHPELGYGSEEILHPNTLLIFEVELLEAEGSASSPSPLISEIEDPQ